MQKTILQVPLNKALKDEAEKEALSQGFSSLQEAVRIFLNRLATRKMSITFEETTQLSDSAISRYNKTLDDIEQGKNIYSVKDTDDLVKQLHDAS
ncbi:MAG: hypothetical protein Q8Q49_03405 [bacterium]|nr:hypothetical protein [bacterium]